MSASDSSTPSAVKHEDSAGLSAKKGVMERGLGRDFNITIIAALLSLVVALTTTMITSRIAAGNALKEARRDHEREAMMRLEQALLRETHAASVVVAEGVPAKFPPVGEDFAFDGLKAVSDRVSDYLWARRECAAARTAVEDAQIRAVTKEVSDLNASLAHAQSLEEARRYDLQLREVRPKAIGLINQALRQL